MYTTGYASTLILPAADCPATTAEIPPVTEKKSIARRQYELLIDTPYTWNSDDLIFHIYAERKGLPKNDRAAERKAFFSKGQPCMRSSPLAKRYGWGIHFDGNGRMALLASGSHQFKKLEMDEKVMKKRALNNQKTKE